MKKTLITITAAAMTLGSAQAVQIFLDDFEGYTPGQVAANPLVFNPFDPDLLQWTASATLPNRTHEIFNTLNFGTSRLWVSNTDGTTLSSNGYELKDNMTYTVEFFSAVETSRANRGVDCRFDILVGTDIGTATSAFGGAQDFSIFGDPDTAPGVGGGTSGDKSDHMYQYAFDSGTITAGDKMFIVFERVGITSNLTGGFMALDDVSLDESPTVPEPSSTALLGLGALGCLLRRKR